MTTMSGGGRKGGRGRVFLRLRGIEDGKWGLWGSVKTVHAA